MPSRGGADAPQTRVAENTTDGKGSAWENGDEITVQIGDDDTSTGTYSVDVDANGNVTGLTTKTALYWKNKTAQKVKGWYPADITNDISLKNQGVNGAGLAYALYAETVNTVDYQTLTPIELPFSHQLAKIRVVLEGSGKEEVKELKVLTYPACKFTPNNATTKVTGSGNPEYIPMKKTTYDNGVTYWEANVVPDFILKDDAFQLVVDGNPVKCSITQVTPQASQLHIITLTVIENYTEVDVSNITSTEYTVSGKVHLKGNNQSKDLKITVEAGSKLILENVNLQPSSAGDAVTCKGNTTLILSDKNKIESTYTNPTQHCSGILINNGTLTIEGSGELDVNGNGNQSPGIGAIQGAAIVINGGTINASSNNTHDPTWGSPGIGVTAGDFQCGNITINGGHVTAQGGEGAAGIGTGVLSECGNILIQGENTVVNATNGGGDAELIGKGDSGARGTITFKNGASVNGTKYD